MGDTSATESVDVGAASADAAGISALQNAINIALDVPGVITKPKATAQDTTCSSRIAAASSRAATASVSCASARVSPHLNTTALSDATAMTAVDGGRTLKLVMQYLAELGHARALTALEEDTGVHYDPSGVTMAGELLVIVSRHDMLDRLNEELPQEVAVLSTAEEKQLHTVGDGVYMSGAANTILEDVHSCNILSLAIPQAGPDGTQAPPWLLTGAVDRTLILTEYGAANGQRDLWRSRPRGGSILCLDISPVDPTLCVCGDMSGAVTIFRPDVSGAVGQPTVPGAETVLAQFNDNSKYVVRVKFSHDGQQLATASYDKTVHLYAVTDAGWKLKRTWPFAGTVECVEWVGDSTICAAIRESNMLRLLDADTFSTEEVNMNPNLDDWVSFTAMDLALSPDGKFLLVATDNSKLLLYKLRGSDQLRQFFGAENDGFANPRCLWHPSMLYVYCTAQDNTVHVWEVATQKPVGRLEGHSKCVRALAALPVDNGCALATASYDKSVRLWVVTN